MRASTSALLLFLVLGFLLVACGRETTEPPARTSSVQSWTGSAYLKHHGAPRVLLGSPNLPGRFENATGRLPSIPMDAGDFSSPLFGLATTTSGAILVADAGAGIAVLGGNGSRTDIVLPGVTDIAPIGGGSFWATTGAGEDPESDTGQGIHLATRGRSRMVANLFAFEEAYDPDGGEVPDSNPFDVASLGGGSALVADAGGNSLLRVDRRGQIEVLAIFPDELVSTENLQNLIGCPDPMIPELAFICDTPMMPAEAVPTSVAVGPDGYYYVGELKGFPAPTGESRIWRVSPDASWAPCGSSPDCEVAFDGAFTSIIDLAFGADGMLYVAELDESSWIAVEFGGGSGGTISACDPESGECSVVATEIPLVTAIALDRDGGLWSTVYALIPELADVVRIP